MENNQHNQGKEQHENSQNIETLRGQQPGQQPPATSTSPQTSSNNAPDNQDERHSESSLPQGNNETLGTP